MARRYLERRGVRQYFSVTVSFFQTLRNRVFGGPFVGRGRKGETGARRCQAKNQVAMGGFDVLVDCEILVCMCSTSCQHHGQRNNTLTLRFCTF